MSIHSSMPGISQEDAYLNQVLAESLQTEKADKARAKALAQEEADLQAAIRASEQEAQANSKELDSAPAFAPSVSTPVEDTVSVDVQSSEPSSSLSSSSDGKEEKVQVAEQTAANNTSSASNSLSAMLPAGVALASDDVAANSSSFGSSSSSNHSVAESASVAAPIPKAPVEKSKYHVVEAVVRDLRLQWTHRLAVSGEATTDLAVVPPAIAEKIRLIEELMDAQREGEKELAVLESTLQPA